MSKLFPAVTAAALALFALSISASPATPGIDLGSSSRILSTGNLPASGTYQLVHQGHDHVHASGVVNSVDEAGRKVNLSHGPISQIGWPAMTMDFPVAASVDLKGIAPGTHVDFTLEKGADGLFQVESLTPAKDGK